MSISWIARRGTVPCQHAFPARPACASCRAAPCLPALFAVLLVTRTPWGGLLLYMGDLVAVTLVPAHIESELLLSSSSLLSTWGCLEGGWGLLLSLPALLLPQFCHFGKSPWARTTAPEPFAFGGFSCCMRSQNGPNNNGICYKLQLVVVHSHFVVIYVLLSKPPLSPAFKTKLFLNII